MKCSTICILLALSAGSCDWSHEKQEYVPLIWDNREGIIEAPALLTREHVDRVEHVLRFYEVDFRRDSDTQLLIDPAIDRETLWNFTTKAEDWNWLTSHPPPDP